MVPLLLSALIGITLAALGAGGAMLTVPLLVHLVGVSPRQAVPMSMVIVGGTALVAAIGHFRRGTLDLQATSTFAVSGVVGAWAGAHLTPLVAERTLMLLFAGLLLVVGTRLLQTSNQEVKVERKRLAHCLSAGLGVGVLTGFLGIGGGFLLVPALVFFAHLEPKRATATSLAVIAVNSASGLFSQLSHTSIDWRLTGSFLGATLVGMAIGLVVARNAPDAWLKRAFGVLVVTMGLVVGFLNLR